jgi:hypothetical protein
VPLIKKILEKQKFHPQNVKVLLDSQVVTDTVNAAFDSIINKLNQGDIFFFQYCGHGQQVEDLSNDEADGLDEAFAFYYAPKVCEKAKGYTLDKHYTDDQLKIKIDAIRKKLGPNGQVIMVVDACHSGTIEKGSDDEVVRGTGLACRVTDAAKIRNKNSGGFGLDFDVIDQNMAKFYVFSACRAHELAYELKEISTVLLFRRRHGETEG